jgi:Fe-S cluster biogenesis protein NfuA
VSPATMLRASNARGDPATFAVRDVIISIVTDPMSSTSAAKLSLNDRVQAVIDLIRPSVQADGGDIELVGITEDGIVQVRFHGACNGCPSSNLTLHMGIERTLRDQVPQVTRVVAVP